MLSKRRLSLILIAAWAGAAGLASARASSNAARRSATPVIVSVNQGAVVGRVRPGYLGLSIEYWSFESSAGRHPNAVDPILVQLVRNLHQGRSMVFRIAGGSTDDTWWPVPGYKRPGGVNYDLSSKRLGVMRTFAAEAGVRLMLGLNLAANNPALATAEARAIVNRIGRNRIYALELGNEPELYGNIAFPWFTTKAGVPVTARQPPYDLPAFIRDFSRFSAGLPAVPLAGPASNGAEWLGNNLPQFISAEPRLGVVTMHRYPLQACFVDPKTRHYPTIGRLLSPSSSTGQAQAAAPFIAAAHAHHLPFAIDEINTISCGAPPHMTDSFAMALWAIDTLFAHAKAGVDTMNIHTWQGAIYKLFRFYKAPSHWQAVIEPEYYGLLMFSRAAPPGSRLLGTTSASPSIRAWATRAPDGKVRIVLINDDTKQAHVVSLRMPGAPSHATLERLLAPSASASRGVTLGGQSFASPTYTGLLTGVPATPAISLTGGAYSVQLPAASAAMLTLSGH
jgi:Glycosyl hydrolase family 79 C-terminal beta domain